MSDRSLRPSPDDTKMLYLKLLQDRYGPWGMIKLAAKQKMGMKI